MDIIVHAEEGETRMEAFLPSMVVVGISGARTYGGQMPVLPGKENVCVVRGMTALQKVRNKKLFYQGRHGELDEVRFFRASQVDIDYKERIPMQLDGELYWLDGKDFPLSLKVLAPKIKVLRN
jgi:diacylglycerol kinase family enzyme